MTKHLVWLMIGTLAVAGCRSTQKVQAKSPVQPLPAGSFARIWTAPLDLNGDEVREINLMPDRVFVYTNKNLSCVINRRSGALEFFNDVNISGGVLRAPMMCGEYLVYPTSSSLEIYSGAGRVLKSIPLESPTSASGVSSGDMVYIGENKLGGYGRIVAMDITRLSSVPRWGVLTRGAITGRPALYDKTIFCGSEDGSLVALDEDGSVAWPLQQNSLFKAGGAFMSDITADESGVYAANTDTKLYCLDRSNGRIKWQFYATAPLKTAPSVTAAMVYQWVPGHGIAGIDKNTGGYNRQPKWFVRDAVQFLSEDDSHAYLRRDDNTLLAVDKETGKVQFTSKGAKFSVFTPNTTDSTIYAATKDGLIVAIRPILAPGESGEIVMKIEPVGSLALAK